MAYPSSFTDGGSVFGDLVNFAILPVTDIQQVGGEWRFFVAFASDIPDVNENTPMVYTYPSANGSYEIVTVVSCERALGYVVVTRGSEDTSALPFGSGGYLIQEPTAGTFNRLRNLILAVQKLGGLIGADLPASCEPGNTFRKPTGEFYVCFSADVWTRVDKPSHSAMTGLNALDAHSIYHTVDTLLAWHAAIEELHLSDPANHDHTGDPGMGNPVRKLRCGDDAAKGASPQPGHIYVALDTKIIYTCSESDVWEPYSTLPIGSIFLFETSCPPGWQRFTALDGAFPLGAGAGVWSGLVTGGAATHTHSLPTLISHTHVIPSVNVITDNPGGHEHGVPVYSSSGGSLIPFNPEDAASTQNIQSSSSGSHSHTITAPSTVTAAVGVASPATDANTSLPPYRDIVFCEKL